jgi:hypothetical protein
LNKSRTSLLRQYDDTTSRFAAVRRFVRERMPIAVLQIAHHLAMGPSTARSGDKAETACR